MKILHRAPAAVLADFEVVRRQAAFGIALAVRHLYLELDQLDIDLAAIVGAMQEFRVLPLAAVGQLRHHTDEAVRGRRFHQAVDGDRAWTTGSRFLAEVQYGFDQVLATVEVDPLKGRGSRHGDGCFDPERRVFALLHGADLHDAGGKGCVKLVDDDPVAAQVLALGRRSPGLRGSAR